MITAVGLVKYSRMAQRDGLEVETINKFAACGGNHYANSAKHLRNLLRAAGSDNCIKELAGPVYTVCLLPSSIIKMIGRCPGQFKLRLAASTVEMEKFWEGLFGSESGREYKQLHPFLRDKTPEQLKNRFAIRIHQDAGPFTKNLSVDAISWSSMHGAGNELETK